VKIGARAIIALATIKLTPLVVLASVGVCLVYALATRLLIAKSQAWRA